MLSNTLKIPTYAKLGSLLTCGYTTLLSFMYFLQAYPFYEYNHLISITSIAGLAGVACIVKYSISNGETSEYINYYAINTNPFLAANIEPYNEEPEGRYVP